MPDHYDPKAIHWDHGHDKVVYESVTTAAFMSESRNQEVRNAIKSRKEPESLQLGKLLRKSHIAFSHRPDREVAKTEAQQRWTPQEIDLAPSFAETNGADLKASHIDLSVAAPKTGKDWTSVLKATMSDSEETKWACAKPKGFDQLGEELRKSSVLLHAGRHDFRSQSQPVRRSEQKTSYEAKPISQTVNFGATLGKELRTSSFDVSYGVNKTCSHWQSQQHLIMADKNDKKWACERPKGFDHLIAQLRKTNITLGSDATVYGTEGNKRPVRDDRNKHAAGSPSGL